MPGTYLLIGSPGKGKTTLACTLEHPTLLIDVDCKAHRMTNIKPLVDSGDVTIMPIREPLTKETLRNRALNPDKAISHQPEGYLKTVDLLNDILEDKEEYAKYNTIVLDSLTRLCEHLTRLLIYLRGQKKFGSKVDGDMNWPSWGSYKTNLEELFTPLVQMDRNFICCAHLAAETERDELAGREIVLSYRPMVDGSMKKKLSGYFDEVYYLETKTTRVDGTKYFIRTAGDKYDARTSMKLPVLGEANLLNNLKKFG